MHSHSQKQKTAWTEAAGASVTLTYGVVILADIRDPDVPHADLFPVVSYGGSRECEHEHVHDVDKVLAQAGAQPGIVRSPELKSRVEGHSSVF